METSEIAKSAATISPNCEHKHQMAAVDLSTKNGDSACTAKDAVSVSSSHGKQFSLFMHTHKDIPKLFNSEELKSNTSNTSTSTFTSANIDENDCASSPSDKKKPLHLQIIDDANTYSSNCDERPSSASSADNIRPSPQKNDKIKDLNIPVSKCVPVTSEREDIIQRELEVNDSVNSATQNDAQIIIESSKTKTIDRDKSFVPLNDELRKEGDLGKSDGPARPAGKNDPGVNANSSKNENGVDLKAPESNCNNSDSNNSLNTGKANIRDDSSHSSTPDLTSIAPCADECTGESAEKKDIIHPPLDDFNSSKYVRAVSTSSNEICAETSSELDSANSSTSTKTDFVSSDTKSSLTVDVASALDQVLAELEEGGLERKKKDRPCILQNSLTGDSGSSGTSTPNEDFLDVKKGEENSSSFRVESSMLLPEASLNVIAQMTIGTGAKKLKKNVVTFGEDSLMGDANSVEGGDSGKTEPISPTNTIMDKSINSTPISNAMDMGKTEYLVHSPPNESILIPLSLNDKQKSPKKAPFISGTAAARLSVMARQSSTGSGDNSPSMSKSVGSSSPPSKALAPSPQLTSNGSVVKLVEDTKMAIDTVFPRTCVEDSEVGNNVEKGNGWEKGMSMLADIISNAAPMRTKNGQSGPSNLHLDGDHDERNGSKSTINTMAPVGQSLRLYASIAAQAGISSYSAVENGMRTEISEQIQIPQQVQIPLNIQTPQNMQMSEHLQTPQHVQLPEHLHTPQEETKAPVTYTVPVQQEPVPVPNHLIREIGKIRRYNAAKEAFGEWEDLPYQTYGDSEPRRWCELNIDESIEIPLRRGGRLRVFPNFLGESRRSIIRNSMENCTMYRQYNVISENATFAEPRVQALLSSQAKEEDVNNHDKAGMGYVYRGVSMKARPISREPHIESLSHDLAELYRLPNREWNIGANLVYYRNGTDHTTWHADDTQGEALILCIVVESQSYARPILVKPKANGGFQDGDEEIIIFVGQGDAYEMDGQMQMNYEHCLPMKQEDMSAKRSAIIFRHGNTVPVSIDTGTPLVSDTMEVKVANEISVTPQKPSTQFGHLNGVREGKKLYTKEMLVKLGAHRRDKKGISGNLRDGCESILIDKQDRLLREDDGLCWLQISYKKSDGGGVLCQSYHKKCCIRVFRSSSLENKYAPALYEGEEDDILYRYDGVYTVRAMWDPDGCETESSPTSSEMHTFFLMRQPKRPVDGTAEDGMVYNRISIQELWNEIQKRKGVRKPKNFTVLEPIMEVGRIGDKSNARRRPISSRRVLNSDCNNAKAPSKKKSVNVIPLSNYAAFSGNSSIFQCRPIYSSDSDSNNDSDEETDTMEIDDVEPEVELVHDNGRPKRKSAAVARTYLKEAMHGRYVDMEKSTIPQKPRVDPRKKRSIWSTVKNKLLGKANDRENPNKRHRKEEPSSDDECAHDNVTEPPIQDDGNVPMAECKDVVDEQPKENPIIIAAKTTVEEKSNAQAKTSKSSNKSTQQPEPKKPTQKRAYNRKNQKAKTAEKVLASSQNIKSVDETISIKEETADAKIDEPVDVIVDKVEPEKVVEGSRVNVEYRNTLFKATVRKARLKGEIYEYLIHYDGNKKSNVHWIPLSMIHAVLDEALVQISPEAKPKRGRKRKQHASKVKSPKPSSTNESKSVAETKSEDEVKVEVKVEVEAVAVAEARKFADGLEVYAQYKGVLYRSTVRNSRKNRKGNIEYLIHYDGFKKTADRWMKEAVLHQIDEETTSRFNEQRGVDLNGDETPNSKAGKCAAVLMSTRSTRGNKTLENLGGITQPENNSEGLDMGDLDSGVEFLPGSCVFVAKANALYLAKMVKRRKKGKGTEYLVQFDGMSAEHNEWIPLSRIYELNPKTRKIYKKTSKNRSMPDEDDESGSDVEPTQKTKAASPKVTTRGSKQGKSRPKKPATSKLYDMQNIEPGVTFLPGSTLFVQWKNGLYLGKMVKKRGKGDNMEYLIHYDGYKSSQDEWVSISMVFEINPQTKRAFNKQRKKS